MQYLPTQLDRLARPPVVVGQASRADHGRRQRRRSHRSISLLSHVDVSTLGPLARPERQGRIAQPADRGRRRQRARRALSRLPAPRQDRVDGPRRQVPDGPRHRAARAGAQVRPGGRGLSPQQRPLQERARRRRHRPAAHRAQHPASRRPDRQGGGRFASSQEAQEMRKGGLNSESVPEVLRSPLISRAEAAAVRCRAQGRRAVRPRYGARHPVDAQCPLRSRQHPGPRQRRDRQDRRRPGPRSAHGRRPLRGARPELRDAEEADGRRERQVDPARGAGARRHRQPQPARGHAAARQAEHRRRGHSRRPTPSWSRRPRRRRRRAIRRRR